MKVIASNLAHQVRKRPIPDYLVEVIRDLEADPGLYDKETVPCFEPTRKNIDFPNDKIEPLQWLKNIRFDTPRCHLGAL